MKENLRLLGIVDNYSVGDILPAKTFHDPQRLIDLGVAVETDEEATKHPPASMTAVQEMDDDQLKRENIRLRGIIARHEAQQGPGSTMAAPGNTAGVGGENQPGPPPASLTTGHEAPPGATFPDAPGTGPSSALKSPPPSGKKAGG